MGREALRAGGSVVGKGCWPGDVVAGGAVGPGVVGVVAEPEEQLGGQCVLRCGGLMLGEAVAPGQLRGCTRAFLDWTLVRVTFSYPPHMNGSR